MLVLNSSQTWRVVVARISGFACKSVLCAVAVLMSILQTPAA
jgi:hypothetical protein